MARDPATPPPLHRTSELRSQSPNARPPLILECQLSWPGISSRNFRSQATEGLTQEFARLRIRRRGATSRTSLSKDRLVQSQMSRQGHRVKRNVMSITAKELRGELPRLQPPKHHMYKGRGTGLRFPSQVMSASPVIKYALQTSRRSLDHPSTLHLNLHSALGARPALAQVGQQVGDVIPRVAVQAGAQSLLVEVVGNQTNASAEDEETVEDTHGEVLLGLLSGEGAAVAEQIDEADGDAAVHVEDQVVLLGGRDRLNGQGVVEQLVAGELGQDVLLDKLDTQIGVVARLDAVADTGDELVGLAHAVDELAGAQVLVKGASELLGGAVQGTTESGANRQETGNQGADQILARTGGDDGVHGARHSRTVVGSEHENHLEELGCVVGQSAAEPQQRHDAADANVLPEHVGDGHTGVDAACKQKPSRGLVLGLNDTVFANTTVSPAQPSPPTSPRRPSPAAPDGNDGALLSGGAIAGIVVGVLALVTLAAGCVFVCCRRRRKNRRIKKLATPSPPPSSSSPLPLQRHSPAPAAGPSGREEGVMAGTAAQGSGAVGGEHGEEVDYDGRFFGNDKTRKVAQATFSPVANSKPIAIWPARPAPDPPQGHSKGTPLPSIETESLPVDASPDGAVSAVSTFSNVPLLSNPPYKPTGSPAVGSSPIFATGRKSPVPKGQSGLPRSVQQHHDHQQLQQQWQQQQGQGKRKKKKRRDSSVSSPYETTKIQTEFAPPPKG